MRTRAVHLLLNERLPDHLQQSGALDAKSIGRMLHQVALEQPDKYADIVKHVGDVGRKSAYWSGESLGLEDLRDVINTPGLLKQMDAEVNASLKGVKDPAERKTIRENIWGRWASRLERETMTGAMQKGNAIGYSVASGARGKPLQARAMLSTPALFEDSQGNMVPIFARRSYAAGVSPAEWLAGTYGARKSVIATKSSTAKGGYLAKMAGQVLANQVVTENDCGTENGIDMSLDEPDVRNRFLARGAGGLKPGELVSRKGLALLKNRHKEAVIVRSPLTCESKNGICAKCAGATPDGKPLKVGDHAGLTASTSIFEPVTQMALNCLVIGTLVRMADGSVKAIETIQPDALVLGADKDGNTFPVRVLSVWSQGIQTVVTNVYDDRREVTCTALHALLAHHEGVGFQKLPSEARACDQVVGFNEQGQMLLAHRLGIIPAGDQQCYDLSVDHPDQLFVLANGLVTSNTKHLSGASTQKKVYSGLDWLQRFVQVPDNFPDRAPVAEKSGSVTVREAPQGGHYVFVGDQEHYVPHHLDLKVKTGQVLEAGEPLSEGVVRPDDVVRLRGLGEGRRYYAERYAQMLNDSGTPAQPRSVELLARAAVNHVQVTNPTDDMDGILPDDIVPYNTAMRSFEVPEDAQEFEPAKAVGKYLQKPALHYTPGTLLTPKMAAHLQKNKISKVTVHDKGTSFTPSMVRLQAGSFAEPDWFASLNTSYLGRQLSQRAQRGQDTNVEHNIHFAPRLAAGVGFGDKLTTTGQY